MTDKNWCLATEICNFFFISHCHGFVESFRKSIYKLSYFVEFPGYFVTFIFVYLFYRMI